MYASLRFSSGTRSRVDMKPNNVLQIDTTHHVCVLGIPAHLQHTGGPIRPTLGLNSLGAWYVATAVCTAVFRTGVHRCIGGLHATVLRGTSTVSHGTRALTGGQTTERFGK